jgi:hypothetical protein
VIFMNQDDVTTPTVDTVKTVSEHRSAHIEPGDEAVLTFEPEKKMTRPVLFMSCTPPGARVLTRRVLRGTIAVVAYATTPDAFRNGLLIDGEVSANDPLRIVVQNDDARPAAISASLVSGEEKEG